MEKKLKYNYTTKNIYKQNILNGTDITGNNNSNFEEIKKVNMLGNNNLFSYKNTAKIKKSYSSKEIKSVNNTNINNNSKIYKHIVDDTPVMLYYFK